MNSAMQNTFRSTLKSCGYRVLLFANPERALNRMIENYDPEPLADCIIVSADELGDEAVDAFNRLGEVEETKGIPAILLVSRKNKDQIKRAVSGEQRILMPLGIKIKQLRARLLQLLKGTELEE